MIAISNCPTTGLQRKVTYDFYWFVQARQIIIRCTITYFKDGDPVTDVRLKPYVRDLVASDSYVDPQTGFVLTEADILAYDNNKTAWLKYQSDLATYEAYVLAYPALLEAYNEAMSLSPQNPEELPEPALPVEPNPNPMPTEPGPPPIQEYDFYAFVLGYQPLILPTTIEGIIALRDSQGKFDI